MDSGIILQANRNPGSGQGPFEMVESQGPQGYATAYGYGMAEQHPLLGY